MAKFESDGDGLFIDSKPVIKAWESFSGWYWFATEAEDTEDGKIYFGFVQGFEEEWGYFSEKELNEVIATGQVWEIPAKNLPFSGRRPME